MWSPQAIRDDPPRTSTFKAVWDFLQCFFSFLVLHVLLYFHNFNMRPNFFFPFQSNYIPMVKLKIEASVQNHYKNKIGREDWILFQRWRLGMLKITFCPSMFTYFSSVKSRLTLNYLMHAWLEIENAYREARGLYGTLRFLRMIMINDSIMLISSRTLLRSTSARLVSLVLENFFFVDKESFVV